MAASCDKPEHAGLLPLQHLVEHLRWGCTDQAQQAWLLEAVFAEHAHQLAERQREAIKGFDPDDHWAVYYRISDVESLPDLIDPEAAP